MEAYLIFFSAVLLLGIFCQWVAWRFRFPSILALLVLGFGVGQFFDQSALVESDVLFAIVSLSVAVIMLEGGLTLRFSELKESGNALVRITTVGAFITWTLATVSLYWLVGFGWKVSLLVGAILVVTGPTVIGPLLRNVRPKRNLNSILKWEGIVIDPIGAILAVLVFGALFGHGHGSDSWVDTLSNLGLTVLIGFGLGTVAAYLLVLLMRHHWIPDFLQSVVILVVALAAFTVSNLLQHESGLLTVTMMGIGLANQTRSPVRHIIEFKENLRVILISGLFIVLGGRVGWEQLVEVWKESALLLLALILVVRPASIFGSLIGSGLNWREKMFISMMAPRGIVAAAVSAIFALELSELGDQAYAEEASRIVPIVFSVIFGTVTFYGLAAAPVARRLGLATPNPQGVVITGISSWSIKLGLAWQEAGYRVVMVDGNYQATKRARMAGLPAETANIISEYATEAIDLSGIGRLVAATPNDEVNSLACIGFGHTLGRSNVFQVRPTEQSERKGFSHELLGRHLFDGHATYDQLTDVDRRNGAIRTTLLTDEFTLQDLKNQHGHDTIPTSIIRPSGELVLITEDSPPPVSGDTVVSLVSDDGIA